MTKYLSCQEVNHLWRRKGNKQIVNVFMSSREIVHKKVLMQILNWISCGFTVDLRLKVKRMAGLRSCTIDYRSDSLLLSSPIDSCLRLAYNSYALPSSELIDCHVTRCFCNCRFCFIWTSCLFNWISILISLLSCLSTRPASNLIVHRAKQPTSSLIEMWEEISSAGSNVSIEKEVKLGCRSCF